MVEMTLIRPKVVVIDFGTNRFLIYDCALFTLAARGRVISTVRVYSVRLCVYIQGGPKK